MEPEYEWQKLIVLEQLSDYGKDQFHKMPPETQKALVYDAMTSIVFKEVFPEIQA